MIESINRPPIIERQSAALWITWQSISPDWPLTKLSLLCSLSGILRQLTVIKKSTADGINITWPNKNDRQTKKKMLPKSGQTSSYCFQKVVLPSNKKKNSFQNRWQNFCLNGTYALIVHISLVFDKVSAILGKKKSFINVQVLLN